MWGTHAARLGVWATHSPPVTRTSLKSPLSWGARPKVQARAPALTHAHAHMRPAKPGAPFAAGMHRSKGMLLSALAQDEAQDRDEAPVSLPEGGAPCAAFDVTIENCGAEGVTAIAIHGEDAPDLLMRLTSIFSNMELTVVSANIKSHRDGSVTDEFRVQTPGGMLVPEDRWGEIREKINAITTPSSTQRSSLPAIYGVVADAEIKRLASATENDAHSLELAAAEMAKAAAHLVSIERTIVHLAESATEQSQLEPVEKQRTEAAALLERRMAAMEAAMSARRMPQIIEEPPTAARGGGAEMRFAMGGGTGTGPAAGDGHEIILQGFNWESCKSEWYKVLSSQAETFTESGFTSVWMPPPSDSVSPQGYLPRDLYCLDSQFGNEGELRDCIAVLHENGLKAIADIVINHRCAHEQGHMGKWNKFGGRLAWDHTVICNNNPDFAGTGAMSTGEDYVAAPNIDHTQERVQKDIVEWMQYLRKVGYDGWRFDFTKGYHGEYVKKYIDATTPEMAFGEFWDTCDYVDGVLNYNQNNHRQRTIDWCDATGGTSAAFDFTTKGVLQEACTRGEYWRLSDTQGRPPGVIGLWSSRAVTFIENHDTGSTLNHWPFPYQSLCEGYAYILLHPGTPCVFYDHFWDTHNGLSDAIRTLMDIRLRNGIWSRSKVHIRKAVQDLYACTIDDKVAMKIGWGDWSPNHGDAEVGQKKWALAASGRNFAVWEAQL